MPPWLDLLLVGLGPQLSPRTAPWRLPAAGVVMGHLGLWRRQTSETPSEAALPGPASSANTSFYADAIFTRFFASARLPGRRFNKPDRNMSQSCPAQLCLPPLRWEPSLSPAGEGVCGVVRNAGRPAAALSPCLDEEADVEAAESPPRACFSPTRLFEACGLAEAGCGLHTV